MISLWVHKLIHANIVLKETYIAFERDFLIYAPFVFPNRYFIVIDDIWSNVVWETIKYTFLGNECGSKIITTTRILDVAKEVGGVYQLKPLSPAVSRKLFYQKIFGAEDRCPVQLAVVSEGILKKCGGVKTIGIIY